MDIHSGITHDVILFAILLGLTVTGKYKNLRLVVLVTLLGHLLLTTGKGPGKPDHESLGEESPESEDVSPPVEESSNMQSGPQNEETNTIVPENVRTVMKTVSNSEFDRQFTIPTEYSKTDGILPNTSTAANSKLARSRTSFFDNIL